MNVALYLSVNTGERRGNNSSPLLPSFGRKYRYKPEGNQPPLMVLNILMYEAWPGKNQGPIKLRKSKEHKNVNVAHRP